MVKVENQGDTLVVSFNYAPDYVQRIKTIAGARYDPSRKVWLLPSSAMEELERTFAGEIVSDKLLSSNFHGDIVQTNDIPTAVPLYNFQRFGASFLAQRSQKEGFAFLCDETGIGKTPQSLGGFLLLKKMLGVDYLPTLVITPAAVRHQWVADAVPKFLGDNVSVVEVEGNQAERLRLYDAAEIVVTNYEALLRDVDLLPKRLRYGLVILDECQKVKNRRGKTHRALKRLLKRMPDARRFFLTATPIMNRLDELYALFDLACPGFFGKYSEFRERYMRIDYSPGWPRLIGYRNLDELAARIGPYILRRTAAHPEVVSSLPELVVQNMYVDPDSVQEKLHQVLHDEWVEAIKARAEARSREEIARLEEKCRGYVVLMQGAADDPRLFMMSESAMVKKYVHLCHGAKEPSPKLRTLVELVDDLVPQGKIIVFTFFERMARLIADALQKYNPALFTGANKDTREKEKERFLTDPSCRILIATDAGGVGLNLQVARFMINFDLPWTPGQLEQRYGRIKRFGSGHSSVLVINLLTRETIDERILAALERKEDVFSAVIPVMTA